MSTILGDKQLKPVSFRVREAAEGLLTVIMEHLVCQLLSGRLCLVAVIPYSLVSQRFLKRSFTVDRMHAFRSRSP